MDFAILFSTPFLLSHLDLFSLWAYARVSDKFLVMMSGTGWFAIAFRRPLKAYKHDYFRSRFMLDRGIPGVLFSRQGSIFGPFVFYLSTIHQVLYRVLVSVARRLRLLVLESFLLGNWMTWASQSSFRCRLSFSSSITVGSWTLSSIRRA